MASGIVSTVQQVGAALGVAVVGILFKTALSDEQATSVTELYVSAFVAGMLYNLGAAVVICLLLLTLSKTQRANQ